MIGGWLHTNSLRYHKKTKKTEARGKKYNKQTYRKKVKSKKRKKKIRPKSRK